MVWCINLETNQGNEAEVSVFVNKCCKEHDVDAVAQKNPK